MRLFRI